MSLGIIIAVILLGLALIFIEIFFIPGTTLFGIAGGIAVVAGVLMMYSYYGSRYGNISLIVSLVAVFVCIGLGFRVIQSNRLAMKAEISSKVNVMESGHLNVGDQGVAVTELRPNGKAVFGDQKIEVFSQGEYIQRQTQVVINKITHDKIYVKPLNT